MTEYTELQIVKHALEYYVERPGASKEDIERESRVLESVRNRVEYLKERYAIKPANKLDK